VFLHVQKYDGSILHGIKTGIELSDVLKLEKPCHLFTLPKLQLKTTTLNNLSLCSYVVVL